MSGSLAITASTIDSLTDFVASPVLYVGLTPLPVCLSRGRSMEYIARHYNMDL